MPSYRLIFLFCLIILVLLPTHTLAFGAGNIGSTSKVEGHNFRHGDIEDMLKHLAHLKHHKWTEEMIKKVYFGNWLRDYSQAMDVATLKGLPKTTIRLLVWILAFMSFGYATGEFEVTEERLGVYRPEEHIDNPKDYADNADARQYDPRLRPPVVPGELAIDFRTGMKNYIANEQGGWATSLGYVKYSFERCIHFGRAFTNGIGGTKGKDENLSEALRFLGQGLHCLEDFAAHSNYIELCLRELGFHNVFPHTGIGTQIDLRGKRVFPLVTGTFGTSDFLHSVIGEATDHVTQFELEEMDQAFSEASNTRGTPRGQDANGLIQLLSQIPGTSALCQEATNLEMVSNQQAEQNSRQIVPDSARDGGQYVSGGASSQPSYPAHHQAAFPAITSGGGPPKATNFDAEATIAKIYPILAFRDKVVRKISSVVAHIPGLSKVITAIQEKITLFIMSILAPFILPVIRMASDPLKVSSNTVLNASEEHQYEPWNNAQCTDPTHSMLSKDHFSNILNEPAGQVAVAILQHVVPQIVQAWDCTNMPVGQVLDNVTRVFHHPGVPNPGCEVQRKMFDVVGKWVQARPDQGASLNTVLGSESVRIGGNHSGGRNPHINNKSVGLSRSGASLNSVNQSGANQHNAFRGDDAQVTSEPPNQPSFAAAPRPDDPYTYPTAYQQGYEIPYRNDQSAEQRPYEQPSYEQQSYEQPPYEQPPYEQPPYEQPPYNQQTYNPPVGAPYAQSSAATSGGIGYGVQEYGTYQQHGGDAAAPSGNGYGVQEYGTYAPPGENGTTAYGNGNGVQEYGTYPQPAENDGSAYGNGNGVQEYGTYPQNGRGSIQAGYGQHDGGFDQQQQQQQQQDDGFGEQRSSFSYTRPAESSYGTQGGEDQYYQQYPREEPKWGEGWGGGAT